LLHTDVIKNKKTNLIYFLLTKHKHFIILFCVNPTFIIFGTVYVLYLNILWHIFFHFMNRTNLLVCSQIKEKKDSEINVKYLISFAETKQNIFFLLLVMIVLPPYSPNRMYVSNINFYFFKTSYEICYKYSPRTPKTTHHTTFFLYGDHHTTYFFTVHHT
jgi:hypothetical protein